LCGSGKKIARQSAAAKLSEEGEKGMTQRKQTTIRQGAVTDIMSHLANLPERGKAPDDPVSLSEIFRTKEYIAEIKAALKRGYSFGDLAEIFTGMCGVAISARQIRYHYTRGENQGAKGKSGRKAGEGGTTVKHVSSEDSPQKGVAVDVKGNFNATDSEAKFLPKPAGVVSDSGVADGSEPGAFPLGG
jgi:hypothetical protein